MNAFQEFGRAAAKRFLQSALVVDNQAYMKSRPPPTKDLDPPDSRDGDEDAEGEAENDGNGDRMSAEPTTAPSENLNAKELIEAFATEGLVCGVLSPDPPEEPEPDLVVSAALRCDILILDWKMEDEGGRALDILAELAAAEAQALRLVAIYTAETDLQGIADQVKAEIGAEGDGLVLNRDGLRVVFFGKEGSNAEEAIRERDLPARLITEFSRRASGLVPAATLHSLAALREEMHRVLSLLGSELDPGYLGHRILLADPEDAGDHLIALITSELRSIVEDDKKVRQASSHTAVELWVDAEVNGNLGGDIGADLLKGMLAKGLADAEYISHLKHNEGLAGMQPALDSSRARSQTRHFTNGVEAVGYEADAVFGARLSLRTMLPTSAKRLQLGSILLREDSYFICGQPACDSVRLDEPTSFPLIPLKMVDRQDPHDFVVPVDGAPASRASEFRYLRLKLSHVFDLEMVEFKVDGQKRVALGTGDPLVFASTGQGDFTWMGQLREAHAMRLAHWLGERFSRVGLDESEIERRSRPKER